MHHSLRSWRIGRGTWCSPLSEFWSGSSPSATRSARCSGSSTKRLATSPAPLRGTWVAEAPDAESEAPGAAPEKSPWIRRKLRVLQRPATLSFPGPEEEETSRLGAPAATPPPCGVRDCPGEFLSIVSNAFLAGVVPCGAPPPPPQRSSPPNRTSARRSEPPSRRGRGRGLIFSTARGSVSEGQTASRAARPAPSRRRPLRQASKTTVPPRAFSAGAARLGQRLE